MLEKLLKNNEKIFYVEEAHTGDGYDDFNVYYEDCAKGISNASGIEILGGESL